MKQATIDMKKHALLITTDHLSINEGISFSKIYPFFVSKSMRHVALVSLFCYFLSKLLIFIEPMSSTNPLTEQEQEQDLDTVLQEPAKVVLFNDEVHTFEEVIGQIIKATGCDLAKAEALTWEVHNSGKAMVYEGEMTKCVQVSGILEEIELMTQIEV